VSDASYQRKPSKNKTQQKDETSSGFEQHSKAEIGMRKAVLVV